MGDVDGGEYLMLGGAEDQVLVVHMGLSAPKGETMIYEGSQQRLRAYLQGPG